MKKTSLILVMSIILFGCNSDDIKGAIDNINNVIDNTNDAIDSLDDITSDNKDEITELETALLTSTQKQIYAQISTDVNTLVLSIAGMCVDKQDNINPDFTSLNCNIADHLIDLATTEFTNIVLLNGKLDITRPNENLFIIKTNKDVTFKAPTISSNTIRYQLQNDNKISVQVSNEDDSSLLTSFSGFYTDGSQSDNSSWTIASINDQSFSFTEDDNTKLIALTDGQALLTGKNEQTYSWSTNAIGKVILKQ